MGPLEGIRVVDLTIGQMGPAATALLADFGAEVIKIESLRGDPGRGVELQPDGTSAFFLTHNRGKKSITLNLRHPEGREVALRLAERSDVFVQSWTPGTIERLGLGYEAVRERNPSIIYASASGFGRRGPKAQLPAMDMVAQGVGGLMMANAGPDGAEPVAVGPTVADQTGAFLLALGILLALVHRQRTGRGQQVDASLLGGTVALQGWHIAHYLRSGRMALMAAQRTRRSPLFTFYRARDGWLTIAIIDPRQWPALCSAGARRSWQLTHAFQIPKAATSVRLSSLPSLMSASPRARGTNGFASSKRRGFPVAQCSPMPSWSMTRRSSRTSTS